MATQIAASEAMILAAAVAMDAGQDITRLAAESAETRAAMEAPGGWKAALPTPPITRSRSRTSKDGANPIELRKIR